MTELTRLRIVSDPDVFASAIGPFPNGKFGVYIGGMDLTPSGSPRPRVLLTSEGVCDTADEAQTKGEQILSEIRKGTNAE